MARDDLQEMISEVPYTWTGRKVRRVVPILGILAVIICLALLIAVIYLGATRCRGKPDKAQSRGGPSLTPLQLESVANVLSNMNSSVDPCEDFYQYACGGWMDRTTLAPNSYRVSVSGGMIDEYEDNWRAILHSPISDKTDQSTERKVKEFYMMCTEEYGRMKEGGKQMIRVLQNDFRGWYVLDPDNWLSQWDLQDALIAAHGTLRVTNAYFRFEATLNQDVAKIDTPMIRIYPSLTTWWKEDYHELVGETEHEAYKQLIRSVTELLIRDANITEKEVPDVTDEFINDVIVQEQKFAELNATQYRGDTRHLVSNSEIVTLDELSKSFTSVNMVLWLRGVVADYDVTPDTRVILSYPGYFQWLDKWFKEAPKRVLHNYIIWKSLEAYVQYLSWEYGYAWQQWQEQRDGTKEFPATWEACLTLIQKNMAFALAGEMAQTHTQQDRKQMALKIFESVKAAFVSHVEKLDWMDSKTKQLAISKVEPTKELIGFPDHVSDKSQVNQIYQQLRINKTDGFFRSLLNIVNHQRYLVGRRMKSTFGENYAWDHMVRDGHYGVNGWYSHKSRTLFIGQGRLQSPQFSPDGPAYINYGGFGAFLGSNLWRIIDDQGRYIFNGSMGSWWDKDTLNIYNNESDCYRDYFKSRKVGPFKFGNHKNIMLPLETFRRVIILISKLAGQEVAYQAYKKDGKSIKDPILPGLNLTKDQLFFLTSAQQWCYKEEDRHTFIKVLAGTVPTYAIINAIMAHSPDFSNTFNCPVGSKLRLESNKQCTLY